MRQVLRRETAIVALAASLSIGAADPAAGAPDPAGFEVPPGYRVSIFAEGLGKARLMQLTPEGDVLLTVPPEKVLRLRADRDGDGRSDGTETLLDGLRRVHGILLDGSTLYLAEETRILSAAYDGAAGRISAEPEVVLDGLPGGGGHWTRTIKKGPDGMLYVTAGSSCNVCEERQPFRAMMLRFLPGEAPEVVATGLRNTVGFDWQPGSGDLYGVDNGRDWLGDDFPPCELNRITQGGFYGWPYFNGENRPDPDVGDRADAASQTPLAPAHGFGAHTAPLSIRFLRHQKDATLNGSALVAQHGSWNRSTLAGYQVVRLTWLDEAKISEVPFMTGFRDGGRVLGRPVDVIEAPDGMILVSDDKAGVIWRVDPAE
ncbi:MAG: PQQ-dependent sugar dehydrogenase [Hyphomicrobiaceae bacterium]